MTRLKFTVALAALAVTAPSLGQDASGVDTSILSQTVRPGDDFHAYANEGWFGTTELPPGRASLSMLNAAAEDVQAFSEGLIADSVEAYRRGEAGQAQRRIAELYLSYTDMVRRNRLGIAPLRQSLDEALTLQTKQDAAAFMGRVDSHALTHAGAWLDPGDPSNTILWLDRNGGPGLIGLLDKDDYASQSPDAVALLAAYRAYIQTVFEHAGVDRASERADAVIALETRLAEGMWSREQLNDRRANHNVMSVDALSEFAPGFDWVTFIEASGAPADGPVNLAQDTAVRHAAQVFADTPLDWWRSYLAFHHIDDYWSSLSEDFDQAGYEFKYGQLHGIESRPDVEARAASFVSSNLRDDIGRLFVEQRFSDEARDQTRMIVSYVRRAMADAFRAADWMDEPTRDAALEKLAAMRVEVGFPDAPTDYSGVDIRREDFAGNRRRLKERARAVELARIGGPYPAGLWFMGAQQVDAAYSPQLNLIIFPAGVLQPPMFQPGVDPAANFGSAGVIFAHEMGHAFDHQGSNFDAKGRFAPWWTDESRAEYEARTDALVEQYCATEVLPGVPMRCEQMRGEIIADLSGLELAYRAYEMFVEDQQDGAAPVFDGLTGPERFFLAREQMSRIVTTDAWLERQAAQSSHPPGIERSLLPLRNFTPWYETFEISEGDALYRAPESRVELWREEEDDAE